MGSDDWLYSDDEAGDVVPMEQRDADKARATMREVRIPNQIGYREGVEVGKLESLQRGFDDGYNKAGVALGSAVGEMRGTVAALLGAFELGMLKIDVSMVQSLQQLAADLENIDPSVLFEPDWEHLRHESEHHGNKDATAVIAEKRAQFEHTRGILPAFRTRFDALCAAVHPAM